MKFIDNKIIKKFIDSIEIDGTDEKKIERVKNLYLEYMTYIKKSNTKKSDRGFQDFMKIDPAIVMPYFLTKEEMTKKCLKLNDAFEESLKRHGLNIRDEFIEELKDYLNLKELEEIEV